MRICVLHQGPINKDGCTRRCLHDREVCSSVKLTLKENRDVSVHESTPPFGTLHFSENEWVCCYNGKNVRKFPVKIGGILLRIDTIFLNGLLITSTYKGSLKE